VSGWHPEIPYRAVGDDLTGFQVLYRLLKPLLIISHNIESVINAQWFFQNLPHHMVCWEEAHAKNVQEPKSLAFFLVFISNVKLLCI
jgi:hypothetical protein